MVVNNPSCDSVLKEQMDNYSTFSVQQRDSDHVINNMPAAQEAGERETLREREESQI